MKAQTVQTILASTLLVAALVLLALALTLHRLTLDSVSVDSGNNDATEPCPIMVGKSTGPCLPITIGTTGTTGNTELYLGYVEILDHCVNQDELLGCVEFEHASKLNARDCDLAVESARLMCFLIGAPVSESVIVPQRR